ncbi:DUF1015 family protein, partial [Oscillospiraceae bacterium OttesenSCG-928-G22]|nr:DUF1015 family protein [Oscillospiraceae bacterium OttesenSCG-928-G22]
EYAAKVGALPYDVMSSDEAREEVRGNPYSFLHVDKSEVDLDPAIDLYDDRVYAKASENLKQLEADGVLVQDPERYYYIYCQTMDGRKQYGFVACPSIDDYLNNNIKKHEFTRADKEKDRIRHVDETDANTGPIFLTHRPSKELSDISASWRKAHAPVYDYTADDGIGHTVWVIDDAATISNIEECFSRIDALYIADGHHRCASAVKVGEMRRKQNPNFSGDEEFNFFLAVIFSSDELKILDYNRLVKDLNGLSEDEFLSKLRESFDVEKYAGAGQMRPEKKHTFGMYLGNTWYSLTAHSDLYDENDPTGRLDVSILQTKLLEPILGIGDPRVDKRIDFVGGIRGLKELEDRVAGGMAVAFSLFPTTIEDLMAISDAGLVMPPKSTWFEPKLRSGLFVHKLS